MSSQQLSNPATLTQTPNESGLIVPGRIIERASAEWNTSRPLVHPDEIRAGVALFPKFKRTSWQETLLDPSRIDSCKITDFLSRVEKIPRKEIELELVKCQLNPEYFIDTYCWIRHPKRGQVLFKMFDYQRRKVLPALYSQKYFITRKFRQGGFSTLAAGYALWMALFETDREILVVSKSDREAKNWMAIVQTMWKSLPDWMRCKELEKNKSVLRLETGSGISAYTPKAGRSFAISFLMMDEAAFIDDMDNIWAGIFPTVSTGGQVAVVSTVNGVGGWYHKTWVGAEKGENEFTHLHVHHTEHPDYCDPKWEESMRKQLGVRMFRQEILAEFMGSAETYIPYETLRIVNERVSAPENAPVRDQDVPIGSDGAVLEGALKVWQEPVEGREYVMGVDSAIGGGQESDSSVVCVLDALDLTQVAEFSSNEISPMDLAKAVAAIGYYYNTAIAGVEANSIGGSVLKTLIGEIFYDSVFFERPGKPGLTMTAKNRPVILSTMVDAIGSGSVKINSKGLSSELSVWIWNPKTRRAEAMRGYHDDRIMALAIAIAVREEHIRNAPIMGGASSGSGSSNSPSNNSEDDFGWGASFTGDGARDPEDPIPLFDFGGAEKTVLARAIAAPDKDPKWDEPLVPMKSDSDTPYRETLDILADFGW